MQRAHEMDVPYCSYIFLLSTYSESTMMDLDLRFIFFFLASIFTILVLSRSSKPSDDHDFEDLEAIVDVEILNIALSDLTQLEN